LYRHTPSGDPKSMAILGTQVAAFSAPLSSAGFAYELGHSHKMSDFYTLRQTTGSSHFYFLGKAPTGRGSKVTGSSITELACQSLWGIPQGPVFISRFIILQIY
jgi:hypothetical protein